MLRSVMPTTRRARLIPSHFCIAIVLSTAGCLHPELRNPPLDPRDTAPAYRFETLEPRNGNTDDIFVCLCFSGGGTRAAALAYGVLEGLRETRITGPSGLPERSLLSEVDIISSVSGGSFTSMVYALEREKIFTGAFRQEFLYNNTQKQLLGLVLQPLNFLRLSNVLLDRIDLAAEHINDVLFHGALYAKLIERGDRPHHVVTATNMSLGERFEFTQDDFDVLGSDLKALRIADAVAASSAFPLLLSPLRLAYHGWPKEAPIRAGLTNEALERASKTDPRRYKWLQSLTDTSSRPNEPQPVFDSRKHKYVYLLDGGVTDNLGATHVIQEFRNGVIRDKIDSGKTKKILVIVVDASTNHPERIEDRIQAPGLMMMARKSATTGVYNYATAMTRVLRYMLKEDPKRIAKAYDDGFAAASDGTSQRDTDRTNRPKLLDVEYYLTEISLHRIEDESRKARCLGMPTSLFLRKDDVDVLIAEAKTQLAANADLNTMLGNQDRTKTDQ